jgi:hypothetical protein
VVRWRRGGLLTKVGEWDEEVSKWGGIEKWKVSKEGGFE